MGATDAEAVASALIARGRSPSTPVALIENASRAERAVAPGTLASLPALAASRGGGPVMVVVGEVVRDVAAHAESGTAAHCAPCRLSPRPATFVYRATLGRSKRAQ